jgi:hypothetical protein
VILLAGCGSSIRSSIREYDDNDSVAIVRDKEITIGELRFLYPDEDVLENIEGTVQFELMLQEAKKMNLDVSENLDMQKETMLQLPLRDENDPFAKSIHEFIKSQSKKLDMEPEEYYQKYVEIRSEQNAYLNAYTQSILSEPTAFSEEELELYNEIVNESLSELVKKHKKDIVILIK